MSVSFQGTKRRGKRFPETLDVTNGLASRLLHAMGYPVGEETAGTMPLKAAIAGIENAKAVVSAEDRVFLDHLAEVCADLKRARRTELVWF